jgi:hypothetical protein
LFLGEGEEKFHERPRSLEAFSLRQSVALDAVRVGAAFLSAVEPVVKARAVERRTPLEFWKFGNSEGVEPRRLPGSMAVVSLLDLAGPSSEKVSCNPSSAVRRSIDAEGGPSMRRLGMLEDSSAPSNCGERRGETASIVAFYPANLRRRPAVPVPTPPGARRVSDYGQRAVVETSIALFIPTVHVVDR